ncbi:MAG: hypothetical protein O2819_04375 [Planctomycetota bacterium]|nr:hypothetical protein [Planctomycetota bacterium]MDA1106717.1 hypothetical protein [Planctomycetota bacterium]
MRLTSLLAPVACGVGATILLLSTLGAAGSDRDESSPPRAFHDLTREEALALIDQVVRAERAAGKDSRVDHPAMRATSAPFWNWETPLVHPLELTPDRSRLLAVNLPDGVLEVFDVTSGSPVSMGAVAVGVDPVSVRARSNSEAWVVNHISDSISIVDLTTMRVRATLATGDEPCDVVFAGSPSRAFVSVSQLNQVRVFDPGNLSAAPTIIAIEGEDPRALATDGTRVYAAIFESGNNTTLVPLAAVSSTANPYPGDPNPPPNSGNSFDPPIATGLPSAPDVSVIVRRQASDNTWRDDNNGNWTSSITWGMHDHDLAIINASSLAVTYANGLMNTNMAVAVGPGGRATVVGTEATNEVRFEPNIQGTFVHMRMASVDPTAPGGAGGTSIVDLNPHLNYSTPTVPQSQRDLSVGDPRAVVWNAAGTAGWIAGMGSDNVVAISAAGVPTARVTVGAGPAGLALDEARDRVYALNRFDGSISVVSASGATELSRIPLHDSTPQTIRGGRPFLYDTHRTSGLGHASCGSCHVDARIDFLAWDLGNPAGSLEDFDQVCNFGLVGGCEDFHPMKGPMTTQTLVGIIGAEPLHWRGDRGGIEEFNPAFMGLLGDDAELTNEEMAAFAQFLATLRFPPNPNRNLDNSLKTSLAASSGTGNPANGHSLFLTLNTDGAATNCNTCHQLPTGGLGMIISGNLLQEPQSMKVPQLQNMHEKTGFSKSSQNNNRGFAFTHDGADDTLQAFLSRSVFTFSSGSTGQQQRRDLETFMFSLATDTHAAVGAQVTIESIGSASVADVARLDLLESLAQGGDIELIVKGRVAGLARGGEFLPSVGGGPAEWHMDRSGELLSSAALRAMAAPGGELTFTAVANGTSERLGIDRDLDGYLDRDEVDAGSDPADADSVPQPCAADINGDGLINGADLAYVLGDWGACSGGAGTCPGDIDGDGTVAGPDLALMLAAWGPC